MKTKIKVEKEVEIKTLKIDVGPRYWEDATVNGVEDTVGKLIPFRNKDRFVLFIDVDKGVIKDWPKGTKANIHYKVCDDGLYSLQDENGETLIEKEYYVPNIMPGEHYGDYIILDIDEDGKILNWKTDFSIKDFMTEED